MQVGSELYEGSNACWECGLAATFSTQPRSDAEMALGDEEALPGLDNQHEINGILKTTKYE